jgi:hypothetical protein
LETNSYQQIKNFIYKKIQDIEGVLPSDKIESEINTTKLLMKSLGLETFAKILSVNNLYHLNDNDWDRLKRELETHFNVEMKNGILVQGTEQQQRDNSWWTGKEKLNNESYYWNRLKEFNKKSLPPEVVKTMDEDTDVVMDNIENPSNEKFSRYGMVVGHVQSGKTGNYSAVICKAADAGYKFIVVIAGSINNLRNQTQERLNEAFVGIDKGIPVGVGKLGDIRKELLPISLTTKEQDFNKQDANKNSQGLNFDNINSPIILVIKKNTSTLKNVITWLKAQYKGQIDRHAMLLIDDESDYASINTKDEEDPTIINKKIRELLSLFNKSAYVAFTATPYANIFIDHEAGSDDLGKDLFPKDFIYALDTPDNYFGARKIFLESENKHLIPIDDFLEEIPPKHKKDFLLPSLPKSLLDAIRTFIINVGIRNLRKQGHKHNSMLIHATRFTMVHKKIGIHVENYFSSVKKDIESFGKLGNGASLSKTIKSLKDTFENRFLELEFNWVEVLESICEIINTIIIREVHSQTKIPLEYRKDIVTNAIVIGGTSLSRGFTLEGLSVSYFLRNTVFYDTLMQMGRWFGYRLGYEDLCHIYMPTKIIDYFTQIIESTEDLFDDFKKMSEAKMTPEDFGLSVKYHPDSGLQVTARNKQMNSKDIFVEMKLDGHLKETSWLFKDENIRKRNLKSIVDIIKRLKDSDVEYNVIGNRHLWRDVEKDIVSEFLDNFQVYMSDAYGLRSRMPIIFIKEYLKKVDTTWDIALFSGNENEYKIDGIFIKKEYRKIYDKGSYFEIHNRQVSSGNAEAIVFSTEERQVLGSKRKDIRAKMKKPLLMLHVLQTSEDDNLAAYGISFPGGVTSTYETVKLKINSVYYQDLLNEEEFDD